MAANNKFNRKTSTRTGEIMLKSLHESMDGFKEIRVLGTEKTFYNTFAISCKENSKVSISQAVFNVYL